jgi:hypothetical protein
MEDRDPNAALSHPHSRAFLENLVGDARPGLTP